MALLNIKTAIRNPGMIGGLSFTGYEIFIKYSLDSTVIPQIFVYFDISPPTSSRRYNYLWVEYDTDTKLFSNIKWHRKIVVDQGPWFTLEPIEFHNEMVNVIATAISELVI